MTQKERILSELIQEPSGLTSVELGERTGIPEPSLRTNIWAMQKDGWIEPVGGVRGRYRYGVTTEGRRQVPAQPTDAIAETLRRAFGVGLSGPVVQEMAWRGPAEPSRQLLEFVRWLSKVHADLLAADDPDVTLKLEDAAADFIYLSGREDGIKSLLGRFGLGQQDDDR